jgi:predicted nucleic acid-binding protein
MAGVVLDTSVWIQMERTESLHPLISADDELFMSAPVLADLKLGVVATKRTSEARTLSELALQVFLSSSTFLPIDEKTAEIFAQLMESSNASGGPRGINDLWIAASAIQYHAELVSLDRAAMFQGLPGLTVRS